MLYFRKDLLEAGIELIKSSQEFGDLLEYANKLSAWINGPINQFNYLDALKLDKSVREEYVEIGPFEELANRVSFERGYGQQLSTFNSYEYIRDRLKFDFNVLCGKALLKAKKITDLVQILA